MIAVGVDACRGGWVAVVLADGLPPAAHLLSRIEVLSDVVRTPATIGIDIPIGLPDAGRRRADVEGRAALGRRASTLFVTPIRRALEAPTHAEATAVSRRVAGFGISVQAFGLRHRIFEVERWLGAAPGAVVEVHPELSFTTLTGRPPQWSKRTGPGEAERQEALTAVGIDVGGLPAVAPPNDVLDAAVVAWTVQRVIAGTARPFPDPPERYDGRAVAIWA